MKFGYRALAILVAASPLFAAVSCEASEAKRLRQQCLDDCRIEVTTCTTKCSTGDCLELLHAAAGRLHKKLQEDAPRQNPLETETGKFALAAPTTMTL